MKRIAIIGGGAAGIAAAISAGRNESGDEKRPGSIQVTLFEASERIGKSILTSGNGRCNFSNASVDPSKYYQGDFVAASMGCCEPREVFAFFRDLGLLWQEEGEGRLYPITNKASSVLDVLRFAAQAVGVKIECDRTVYAVTPVKGSYLVSFDDDQTGFFDEVIVACGGKIARSILPPRYPFYNSQPVLGPLKTNTDVIRGLNNLRVRCAITCGDFSEQGEVLFRDYGISGIVVFNLSRFVHDGDVVMLDLLPSIPCEEIEAVFYERFLQLRGRSALEFCAGMLQQPLARAVLKRAQIEAGSPLQESDLPALGQAIKAFTLVVEGIEDPRQCQVQRGGFAIESFDPTTLESINDPGLFVVGEALDVDGPCGGYNLHWAWTSGILAGRSAATRGTGTGP